MTVTPIVTLNPAPIIITNTFMQYFEIAVPIALHGILDIAGMSVNLVNMLVFHRLGLKDSMNVSLFALSLSDFVVTTLRLVKGLGIFVTYFLADPAFDFHSANFYIMGWIRFSAFHISSWITTFISIERCVCVVYPFHIRQIFSRNRCICVITVIYVFFIAIHLPILASVRLTWREMIPSSSSHYNETKDSHRVLDIVPSQLTQEAGFVVDIATSNVLSFLSQSIIIICAFWMFFSLKTTSKVRHTMITRKKVNKYKGQLKDNEFRNVMSPKERKLMKVVLLLASVLTLCNIPKFAVTIFYHILPVEYQSPHRNVSAVMMDIAALFMSVNCTLNFFVYITLNSQYVKVLSCRQMEKY